MNAGFNKQLIVLVEGADDVETMKALLGRHRSFGIRDMGSNFDVFPHPNSASGCVDAHEFLRPFQQIYLYAIVLMDYAGSNYENRLTCENLKKRIEQNLTSSGWQDRSAAIIVNPELENWVWSNSHHVEEVLGWKDREPALQTWLIEQKWLESGKTKPAMPKEAMEAALRAARLPRSASLYRELAQKVSIARCEDPALIKLKQTLQTWFPIE